MKHILLSLFLLLSSITYSQELSDWYPWNPNNNLDVGEIGMQDWIEQPAGRHGRIARQDDVLIYNGKPIKLWGLNLCYNAGCAPDKAIAERRAKFYAKYGINAVRLHKYADGPGWRGINSRNSYAEFDPEDLDRMDYLIAQLKKAGIYILLSPHFGTVPLGPDDKQDVPYLDELATQRSEGLLKMEHCAVYYSPEIQAVTFKHVRNLMNHKNPYTGLTYAEDPAIAFVEIINEQSIMFYTSMNPLKASPTLRKIAGKQFCDWLRQRYGDKEGLIKAWGKDAFNWIEKKSFPDLDESLDENTILPLGHVWYWSPEFLAKTEHDQRMLDTLEYLYELQNNYYDRYEEVVRKTGYTGEMVASNWQAGSNYSHFANLHSDYRIGTIDRHNYYKGEGKSMLQNAGSGLLSSGMQQVVDRPFMLSEWLCPSPNELAAESVPIISTYGMGLQGWDVSYIFQNRDDGEFKNSFERFDVAVPNILGLFPAISRQVLRGDVTESDVVFARNVHVPSLFEAKLGFVDEIEQEYDDKQLSSSKVPAGGLAVARQVVRFTDKYQDTPVFDMAPYMKDGKLVSSTGELCWKESSDQLGGYFTINTPATKAVVGFAKDQSINLGGITIQSQSEFAVIYLTAKAHESTISDAKELLITAMGRARNTPSKSDNNKRNRGQAPILLEPVQANIKLNRNAEKVTILDHDGFVTKQAIPVNNGIIKIDTGREKTPYYIIRFK